MLVYFKVVTISILLLLQIGCDGGDKKVYKKFDTSKAYHDKSASLSDSKEDGGYGLIGLQRAEADVFNDINWGTEDVCSDTCRHFNTLGMNWALMPLLWDVDRPEDVDRWRSFISVSDQSDS